MIERENGSVIACTYCHSSGECPTCAGWGFTWLYFCDRSGRERQACQDCNGTGTCVVCQHLVSAISGKGTGSL